MVIKNIKVKMLLPHLPPVEVFNGRPFEEVAKGLAKLAIIHQLDNKTKFGISKKRDDEMGVLNLMYWSCKNLCALGEMYAADYQLILDMVDYCRHKHKLDPDGWYQYYEQGFLNLLPSEWKVA